MSGTEQSSTASETRSFDPDSDDTWHITVTQSAPPAMAGNPIVGGRESYATFDSPRAARRALRAYRQNKEQLFGLDGETDVEIAVDKNLIPL
jgi:hypothetical protein